MNNTIITPKLLQEALNSDPTIQLIDVRTAEKHAAYNVGGLLIPIEELAMKAHLLDKQKKVVTYCTSGGKSMLALQLLKSLGFNDVQSLEGGMTAWQKMVEDNK